MYFIISQNISRFSTTPSFYIWHSQVEASFCSLRSMLPSSKGKKWHQIRYEGTLTVARRKAKTVAEK